MGKIFSLCISKAIDIMRFIGYNISEEIAPLCGGTLSCTVLGQVKLPRLMRYSEEYRARIGEIRSVRMGDLIISMAF